VYACSPPPCTPAAVAGDWRVIYTLQCLSPAHGVVCECVRKNTALTVTLGKTEDILASICSYCVAAQGRSWPVDPRVRIRQPQTEWSANFSQIRRQASEVVRARVVIKLYILDWIPLDKNSWLRPCCSPILLVVDHFSGRVEQSVGYVRVSVYLDDNCQTE